MVVYTPDQGEFKQIAENIAETRGERTISSLESAEIDDEVLYVGSQSEIDESDLLELQQRSLNSDSTQGRYSIVTGYTPELAEELYYTSGRENGRHCLLFSHHSEDSFSDDGSIILSDDDATATNLRETQDDGLTSLSLYSHGWTIHLNLTEGFICGFPDTQRVEEYSGKQPYCVQDGERDCPFDDHLVSAEEVDASHVFVASCASMVDNGLSGLPVHLGSGLLNGAASLIGSYRTGPSLPHESILHYSLLRAGYDVSERCYILNQNSHTNDIMAYPYVPFGDPTSRLRSPTESRYDYSIEEADSGARIEITDVQSHVIDVHIPPHKLPQSAERYYVRDAGKERSDATYYAIFGEGEGTRLVLYSGERMNDDRLTVHVTRNPVEHARRGTAFDSLRNAQRLRSLDVLDGTSEEQLSDLWNQLRNLPERFASERYEIDARRTTQGQLDTPFGNIDVIRRQLTSMVNDGRHLHSEYASRAIDDDVYPDQRCCHKCDRPVFIKQVSDGDGTKRALGVCPQCGYVYDVPIAERNSTPPRPTITGELLDDEARGRSIQVHFRNPSEHRMQVTVCPSLLDIGNTTSEGEPIFSPSVVEEEVEPGERVTAEFDVHTDAVVEDQHYVLARVIGNLEIYSATAPFLVGETTGRRTRRF